MSVYDLCDIGGCDRPFTHHVYTMFDSYCGHHIKVCYEHFSTVRIHGETKSSREKKILDIIGL